MSAQARSNTQLKLRANSEKKVKKDFCDQFWKENWKEFSKICDKFICVTHFYVFFSIILISVHV